MLFPSYRRNIQKLKTHKLAIIGMWVIVALYGIAIFADFIAPYSYDNERRDHSYHPPTAIHFFDSNGNFHFRPFVYGTIRGYNKYYERVVVYDYTRKYPIKFLHSGDKHYLLKFIPTRVHLFNVEPPGRIYLLGADSRGRDLFSRILYGSRISLSVGVVGVTITVLLGLLIGGISGYFGGKTDFVLMRVCEMVMMIPGFYLMLALRAAFPINLTSVEVYLLIVIILSFIGWAGLARIIRGMVLSIRKQEFVESARAIGVSNIAIIIKHILPQTISYVIVAVTLSIPSYMLGESGLSLIGLGIQDPYASWGNLLAEAMAVSEIRYHPWILIPGVFIFITVIAFNFLGDGMRDAFDPKT